MCVEERFGSGLSWRLTVGIRDVDAAVSVLTPNHSNPLLPVFGVFFSDCNKWFSSTEIPSEHKQC